MCYARCWLITPSIEWIGDSLHPAPTSSSSRDGGALSTCLLYRYIEASLFFLLFLLTSFIYLLECTQQETLSCLACMVCAEQDSTPQRTEIDYGNKKSYDKRDGEGD